ncbi:CehA/McbA family metallohydrolase [Paenibacillus lemnae]|uniref:CehA/McbA family metallohydrolase n=1 Tax=Paenibacillus lemnae TaxID=1330551 RepID=A0A848M7W2_PAELE|nr:CehA/McbA family metallohydrolase [Paenibacillus lemnae]NMO96735.1 CehA/McbA family metallohydrolase [Paenibacillus lemnae]
MNESNEKANVNQLMLLSSGKRAIAEEQLDDNEAEKAIDGQPDTFWAGGPYYKWWKIDLGRNCQIEQVCIQARQDTAEITHYFIEHSQDNLNWECCLEKMESTPSENILDKYDISLSARYLRVTITYCSAGETAKLYNVQVYGHEAGTVITQAPQKTAFRKFHALSCDQSYGFEESESLDLEPGSVEEVLVSGGAGSYLLYRDVDFTMEGIDQLRGQFGFTDLDKAKQVVLEVRVDDLEGEKVGELILFKQWKRWSMLAGRLHHKDAEKLTGVHDMYLVVKKAAPGQELMIHWLEVARKSQLPAPRPRPEALAAPANGEYHIYFGNLHSHTGFSDGIGVPEYAYDYARYTAGLDFLAITEHSNLYDHYLEWEKSRKWVDIQKIADNKTEDGAFLALFGAETTWYNQFGHMNTYNMDFFINTYETEYNDIPTYYDLLKQYPDSIQQWNHPWSCGNRHLDGFDPYDAELDEVMHMIEINPIESKELGGLYYYVMALDKGWHVAPVGSQDNHHGQWGTQNTLRTGLLVDQLTREHFYDAVRHQRVYFTSALHLKVWFKVNDSIMGSRIQKTDQLDLDIRAMYGKETEGQIVKAEIIGEQGKVIHSVDVQDSNHIHYKVSLPSSERYYFVKIYQNDGEFAATAPVWIEG